MPKRSQRKSTSRSGNTNTETIAFKRYREGQVPEAFICRASDVITIHFVTTVEEFRAGGCSSCENGVDQSAFNFRPEYNHQIFPGGDGLIRGYRGLQIDVFFDRLSLVAFVAGSWDASVVPRKYAETSGKLTPNPIKIIRKALSPFVLNKSEDFCDLLSLPRCATERSLSRLYCLINNQFEKQDLLPLSSAAELLDEGVTNPHPPGKLICWGSGTDSKRDSHQRWEVRVGRMAEFGEDIACKELYARIRIFNLWTIEIATPGPITYNPDTYTFFLYERISETSAEGEGEDVYVLVAFIIDDMFWKYPDGVRSRMGQVVVLPPYQHRGYGCLLIVN